MQRIISHSHHGVILAIAIAAVLLTAIGTTARAEEPNAGAPGEWLAGYATAGAVGLGGALVAASDQPMGILWNPATLSILSQYEVQFETLRLFESTSMYGFSLVAPGQRFPSLGLTVLSLRSGDFERTNELNQSLGEFSETDMAFLFSASKGITPRFGVGANVKIVRQSIEDFNATGVGADIGAFFSITPGLRLGASILNVGGPTLSLRAVDERYPTEFRGGFSVQFFGGRGLVSTELQHRSGTGVGFRGGTEFWVHRKLALRAGYFDNYGTGGFSFQVGPGMRFDYGMADNVLGVTHRVGFSYRFGGFFASSVAVPSVFSPIGQQSVTKFRLKSRTKAETSEWMLEIVDKQGQVVRRFGGRGVPPAHVMWDGKTEAGLPLPDGLYTYELVVKDVEGREIVGHRHSVEILTSGPQGVVPVIIE